MTNISNFNSSQVSIRPLEDLNMMDAFLFQEATANPTHAKMIAQAIIRRTLGLELKNAIVEVEKVINGYDQDRRGIRMDICVSDFDFTHDQSIPSRLIKIEPNKYREKDLPKRSRFSTSLLDAKILPKNTSPAILPTIYSIWILPYDPFGEDRVVYTVKNMVVENPQIDYNDGITKIFLYINGNSGGSKQLTDLLSFFQHSTAINAVDEELSKMHKIIDDVKHNKEVGERYMRFVTYEEYVELAKEHGYITGYDSGLKKGNSDGKIEGHINACKLLSLDKSKTKDTLLKQFSLSDEQIDEYLTQYW